MLVVGSEFSSRMACDATSPQIPQQIFIDFRSVRGTLYLSLIITKNAVICEKSNSHQFLIKVEKWLL
jgi:hypothetical protein